MKHSTQLFMLDNLDSFTYNLVDEFQTLGFEPTIYRNTLSADYIVAQMEACQSPVVLVLSPGPGDPQSAGCLMELIEKTAGRFPILGICLGHQALVEYYGGTIGRAPEIIHGKASNITHTASGVFADIKNPLPVARYHSLVATQVPSCLEVIAKYDINDDINLPMAISHQNDRVIGFQFHPESILTTFGSTLIEQSLTLLTGVELKENDLTNDGLNQKLKDVTHD
ncbi:aminodeoxychorismate/anthranilate synthase component II [Thalassotalea ganghwensis]